MTDTTISGATLVWPLSGDVAPLARPSSTLPLKYSIRVNVPTVIATATYTMLATDTDLIVSGSNCTVTLLNPALYPGMELNVKNLSSAFSLGSASSNVIPQGSLSGPGATGTAILAATANKWAVLKSDGTYWVVMRSN